MAIGFDARGSAGGTQMTEGDSPLGHAIARQEGRILTRIREAIHRRSAVLAYQPVIRTSAARRLVAFHEGLIRLTDDQGRVIPAQEFLPLIEETEIGRMVDCIALELGLATLAEEPGVRLSVNMSARSIGYPLWIETLKRGLALGPTVGERLILEITESSAMMMPEIVSHFMRGLQREGISFMLDDFGAGQTSFRYLREFFFDAIKIDRQFIKGIHADPDNQCLTRALVSIAAQFDMFTVAEGVETAQEAAFLAEMGVDCQQGYFHGAPTTMPPWKAARHLDDPRPA